MRDVSCRGRTGVIVAVALAFSALASGADAQTTETIVVEDAERRCAGLASVEVPAGAFALPTGAARISEATLVPAGGPGGLPEFCRVRGAIASAGAGDPPILFQVNLPSAWNRKTVQFGGGGLNGVVIQATGAFAGGGASVTPALARGYVTYGSDSGHQDPGRDFFANRQAFANYGHEAVKRSKDLATALVRRFYGTTARRNYQIGGSKGGQEGLQAAQRYAADFDGVVSYYPAAQSQSLQLAWNRLWRFAFHTPGGALNTTEQTLLKAAVLQACDGLDGAADGIVSDTAGCARAFDVGRLRCPDGADAGDACLSDPQIAALRAAATPLVFAHPMPNGVRSVGPWPVFVGGDLDTWFGTGTDGSQQGFYRAAEPRPEAYDGAQVDAATWAANVEPTARVFDASNPDLDAFRAKGGKLILLQGTTDMLVPEAMTTAYHQALQSRYGAERLRDFVRYYIAPGYGHGEGVFRVEWDSLAVLDAWVEQGRGPERPVAVDGSASGSGRTRPLCEHPSWPRHGGAGDLDRAESFVCSLR